jgi:hypothetical protein
LSYNDPVIINSTTSILDINQVIGTILIENKTCVNIVNQNGNNIGSIDVRCNITSITMDNSNQYIFIGCNQDKLIKVYDYNSGELLNILDLKYQSWTGSNIFIDEIFKYIIIFNYTECDEETCNLTVIYLGFNGSLINSYNVYVTFWNLIFDQIRGYIIANTFPWPPYYQYQCIYIMNLDGIIEIINTTTYLPGNGVNIDNNGNVILASYGLYFYSINGTFIQRLPFDKSAIFNVEIYKKYNYILYTNIFTDYGRPFISMVDDFGNIITKLQYPINKANYGDNCIIKIFQNNGTVVGGMGSLMIWQPI